MNTKIVALALATIGLGLTSCSDEFMQEKKDLNKVSEIIYDDYNGARGRVDDVYSWAQPDGSKSVDAVTGANNLGSDDNIHGKSTEEYVGLGKFVDPQIELAPSGENVAPDFFQNENKVQSSPWGIIRNINDAIRGISNGNLSESEKNELLGQLYFWRAWRYYNFVKWYGGVPIITEVLEPVEGPGTPRSSAKECFQLIFDDLDKAAEMLKEATTNGGWKDSATDWGRVTTGTAMALKGRVMNLWASPMFNRKNDPARWEAAYNYIKESIPVINSCGYGLVDASTANAKAWADMFVSSSYKNPEAIMLTLYNTIDKQADSDHSKNSKWEQSIRPKNTDGNGGKKPSQMMVDLFPMKDGKRPSTYSAYYNLPASEIEYDENCPWMNRDPRFYRTFAFPGVRWTYNGTPSSAIYPAAADYTVWSYVWYHDDNKENVAKFRSSAGSMGPDGNESAKAFYIRKRSCDADVSTANYVYAAGFDMSATPWIEIRYAEVLLNYAEAAAGAGQMSVAIDQLRALRQRVGYTGDCGIDGSMDQNTTMAAVLYERQIELAYEGKRFDDMRRWMLYDGGATQVSGAPVTWAPSGWNNNTCDWLGFNAFNGQRRENYEFYATTNEDLDADGIKDPLIGGINTEDDPIVAAGVARPAGINLNDATDTDWEALKAWYDQNLASRKFSGDDYHDQTGVSFTINFRPQYYFLGLAGRGINNNTTLEQTIGWTNPKQNDTAGTFDPLAE